MYGIFLQKSDFKTTKTTKPYMKKLLLTFASLVLLLAGCSTDPTIDNIVKGEGVTILTLSTHSTRTSLGAKVDSTYPIHWSEGDKIVVNGIVSDEAIINATDPASATFSINGILDYPYAITYPYTPTTTVDAPKVVFLAEQTYCEGSFCNGSAPMCGYAAKQGDEIAISHLAGALRFPVKAENEGVILDKIVITSQSASLAGEFAVDCAQGTISPCENTQNIVTYTLPSNFTLSTDKESIFYIALPAVNQGKCVVEFVEASGKKMINDWNSTKPISAGKVREFSTIIYKEGLTGALTSFDSEEDNLLDLPDANCYGYIKDNKGRAIKGVAVSDGFSVTTTDRNGLYKLAVSPDAWYIYITVPAEYAIDTDERNLPLFYQKYTPGKTKYDFTLTPIADGVEKKFALFTMTDVHLGSLNGSNIEKKSIFENTIIPHINSECDKLAAQGIHCYGINLGDNISNMGGSLDDSAYRGDILDGYKLSKIPFFSVFGNHDCNYFYKDCPLETDERNSNHNIKAQREHEEMFGPINYSFDRGNVHIVAMRNIIYPDEKIYFNLPYGFTDEQIEWLRQDLALVPKEKSVIFCVHVPIFNSNRQNYGAVRDLLNGYAEVTILSGHNHYQRNVRTNQFSGFSAYNMIENNSAPTSGAAWLHTITGDGTPAGYKIYINDNGKIVDNRYVSYNEGANATNHQMRLYWGDAKFGAPASGSNPNGTKGFYAFNFSNSEGKKTVVINLYNYISGWSVKVYENDVEKAVLTTKTSYTQPSFSALVGDGSVASPWRAADGVETAHDFYATGYMCGYLGIEGKGDAYSSCFHMFHYTLSDNNANIKVVATDPYGNSFTETVIIGDTDFSKTSNQ